MLKFVFIGFLFVSQMALADSKDPEVIKEVDLQKYSGVWYEVGHFPTLFQKLCDRSEAKYTLNNDGTVGVLNTCYRNDKVFTTIEGKAYAPNPQEPTKLIVDFGFARKGDYWIVALDSDYQWAVVSGPKKESLFILSRSAPMNTKILNQILKDLKDRGFDTDKIIFDKY